MLYNGHKSQKHQRTWVPKNGHKSQLALDTKANLLWKKANLFWTQKPTCLSNLSCTRLPHARMCAAGVKWFVCVLSVSLWSTNQQFQQWRPCWRLSSEYKGQNSKNISVYITHKPESTRENSIVKVPTSKIYIKLFLSHMTFIIHIGGL